MSKIKMAFIAAVTTLAIGVINWIVDPHFLTGFLSGWHISKWFH